MGLTISSHPTNDATLDAHAASMATQLRAAEGLNTATQVSAWLENSYRDPRMRVSTENNTCTVYYTRLGEEKRILTVTAPPPVAQ